MNLDLPQDTKVSQVPAKPSLIKHVTPPSLAHVVSAPTLALDSEIQHIANSTNDKYDKNRHQRSLPSRTCR